MSRLLLPATSVLALAAAATAQFTHQITYIDADCATNTTLADGTPYAPVVASSGYGSDNEWLQRPYANGGTVLSTHDDASSNEDAPMLRTTISGLIPGLDYFIYSYWWSDSGGWRGRAVVDTAIPTPQIQGYNTVHFSTSSFQPMQPIALGGYVGSNQVNLDLTFDATGFDTSGHFAVPIMLAEGNRFLYENPLGIHTADSSGEIWVFIDDLEGSQPSSNRTWYDGVGYEIAPLDIGGGCGNAQLHYDGQNYYVRPFEVRLTDADPNVLAALAYNFIAMTPFDIGLYGQTPGCLLVVDPTAWATSFMFTDGNGEAAFGAAFPRLPFLDIPLVWQWAAFDANGMVTEMTRGVEVIYHP